MNFVPIGAIVVLGVPTLLVALVPRRWMLAAMAVWVLSPALLFFALDLVGMAIGGEAQTQPGSPVDALLLVGSLFLIPWIVLCLTGFGIGFAIRKRLQRASQPPLAGETAQPAVEAPATQLSAEPIIPISRPVQPVMEGVSADGALRYEHRQGEFINGRYDSVSLCAVVIDAVTGETLVDCAGWASSEITAQPNGSLFLHLQQNQFESLFRIDGGSRLFRNLGAGGEDAPLADLGQAVREAWLATARRASPPHYRRISPDGIIRVDLASEEWSNSHWVNAPRVIEIATGRVLLDLWGTDWDAVVFFREVGRVRLECRRYHVGGGLAVVLDLRRGCYQITLDPSLGGTMPEQPLGNITQGLEAALRGAASGSGGLASLGARPHPLAAWRAALLILFGALILIAGVAYISMRLDSKAAVARHARPAPQFREPAIPQFRGR